MIIDNVKYPTNMVDIHNIRYLLFKNLYGDNAFIQSLTDAIARNIECLSIDYSASTYTFTIKIKKTAMRKVYGFDHDPNFYYQIVSNIFKEFIQYNEPAVCTVLGEIYPNPKEVLNYLYINYLNMANLCHASCIADNILVIKL